MNYLQIEFTIENDVEKEILIALLANAGFESFEEAEKTLKAFIREDQFSALELNEILKIVPAPYSTTIVPPQNWNAQWESSFEPIVINDFVAVRAMFHPPVQNVHHEIIITPKMSFGTGHHATTYMMIEQMQALDLNDKRVLDFGTGTGVLAILAEKMGAAYIDAIDHDDWSIENSKENINANNCKKINLIKDETIVPGTIYDIILANINLNVILQNLAALKAVSKKDTHIVLSGFIKPDEEAMVNALTGFHIITLKIVQKGEWICINATGN